MQSRDAGNLLGRTFSTAMALVGQSNAGILGRILIFDTWEGEVFAFRGAESIGGTLVVVVVDVVDVGNVDASLGISLGGKCSLRRDVSTVGDLRGCGVVVRTYLLGGSLERPVDDRFDDSTIRGANAVGMSGNAQREE